MQAPGAVPEVVVFVGEARAGCGWLRTVKDNGVCREDPVSRCVSAGECECLAADGTSLGWSSRYKVERLSALPADTTPEPPIVLEGDAMLELTPQEGHGFVYDCFGP